MIDCVLSSQDVARLQQLQLQVHPSLPLHVLRDWVIIPKLPKFAETAKQVNTNAVSIEDGEYDQGEEQDGLDEEEDVEVGVWVGEHLVLTPAVLVLPVPGTARTARLGSTLSGYTGHSIRGEAHN